MVPKKDPISVENNSVGIESSSIMNRVSVAIGTAPEFKIGEDWNLYIERLDQFFLANFIEAERKVPV